MAAGYDDIDAEIVRVFGKVDTNLTASGVFFAVLAANLVTAVLVGLVVLLIAAL